MVEESWGEMKLNEPGMQKSEKQHFYQQVQKAKLMSEILQAITAVDSQLQLLSSVSTYRWSERSCRIQKNHKKEGKLVLEF